MQFVLIHLFHFSQIPSPRLYSVFISMSPLPPENTKQVTLAKIKRGPLGKVSPLINLFSSTSPGENTRLRLCTVGISHYCEKVRWGFDLLENSGEEGGGFTYAEDAHPPGLSAIAVTEINSERSGTPIVTDSADGSVVYDSKNILRKYLPALYPEDGQVGDEVRDFEEEMDRCLGPTARVFAYHHLLGEGNTDLLVDMATKDTSHIETFLFRQLALRGMIQPGMRRFMSVTPESCEMSRTEILRVFDSVGNRLENNGSGRYIIGDRFTAADLSFASLASPLLLNLREFEYLSCGRRDQFPRELKEMSKRLMSTRAGEHVVECYRKYRFGRLEGGRVVGAGVGTTKTTRQVKYKSAPRNRFGAMAMSAGAVVGLVGFAFK